VGDSIFKETPVLLATETHPKVLQLKTEADESDPFVSGYGPTIRDNVYRPVSKV
jgi:hypothetical protein